MSAQKLLVKIGPKVGVEKFGFFYKTLESHHNICSYKLEAFLTNKNFLTEPARAGAFLGKN